MLVKKRLFFVSSPHNALACLSIINQDNENNNTFKYEDYAVFVYANVNAPDKSWPIVNATYKTLNAHTFMRVIDLSGQENDLEKLANTDKYNVFRERIFDLLQESNFDELYMVRNSSNMKPYADLCEGAKLICYGEAYNKLDSCGGKGYRNVDEFRTLLPVDWTKGLLDYVPLNVTPKKCMVKAISDVLDCNVDDKQQIIELDKYAGEGHRAILALNYFSDVGRMSINNEFQMFVEAVDGLCSKDTTILIKDHPRAISLSKSLHMQKLLNEKGYKNVLILNKSLNSYPIEVICYYFRPDVSIAPASTSLLILKYLYGISDNTASYDLLDKYGGPQFLVAYFTMLEEAIKNLDSWDPNENKPIATWKGQPISAFKHKKIYEKKLHDAVQGCMKQFNQKTYESLIKDISNEAIADIFDQAGFKKIIFYGVCDIGKMIIDKLLDSGRGFELYLLDPDVTGHQYRGHEVYSIENESIAMVKADVIVCTRSHSYKSYVHYLIDSDLRQHLMCSFAELLDIYYIDCEIDITDTIDELLKPEAENEGNQKVKSLQKEIRALKRSMSWRITAPLRALKYLRVWRIIAKPFRVIINR